MKPEEEIVKILKEEKIDLAATLPCDKAKSLFALVAREFRHIPLSREEEGVGICAGAYLACGKPIMVIQSSGVGNTINAICSLTKLYELPLPILVSWRGVYKENIVAQVPMGKYLPEILEALDIHYTEIKEREDIPLIREVIRDSYDNSTVHIALLSPKIWMDTSQSSIIQERKFKNTSSEVSGQLQPTLRRYDVIKACAPYLKGKLVVSNLGVPSKELYHILHQKSNFYMLGSMGMASPIGLGVSINTEEEVVVIEGDGSLLMNTGTLATIALLAPSNLTILAIDNGVYGSTGNQPTATSICADLGGIASGFGIKRVYRAATAVDLEDIFKGLGEGPNFIHALALPGNADVPDIPLTPIEIKENVMEFLRCRR
jgi:sulfopyruvate decarboxylase subunit beta